MSVAALIVTYNRLEKLRQCWQATVSLPFAEIVIVDNASSDDTAAWLAALQDPRLTVLRLEENVGGAGGFRHGAAWLAEHGRGDWVLFYDDDAYPAPDLLERFMAQPREEYAVWCCRVTDRNGLPARMNLPWRRFPRTLRESLSYMRDASPFVPDVDQPADVCTISFVGCFVRMDILRSTWRHIRRELFIYFDDVYYSWWLHIRGYRFRYAPELSVMHDVPVGDRQIVPPWKIYYLIRNMLLSTHLFQENKPYSGWGMSLRIFKYLLLLPKQPDRAAYLRCLVKGVRDGLNNRTGKLQE